MASPIDPKDKRAATVLADLTRLLQSFPDDPSSAPTSYASLARRIGVDPATLWRHRRADQRVQETAETIVAAGRAGRLPRREPSKPPDAEPVVGATDEPDQRTTQVLALDMADLLDEARWPLQRFLAKSRRHSHVSDLPRVAFELRRCLDEASRSLNELTDLSDEWLRHQRQE